MPSWRISLQGIKSNGDGIGARIKMAPKSGGVQYNYMITSVGYASPSDGPVHFFLGLDNAAGSIEIHRPSGVVQNLQNVSADDILKVVEPAK